MEEWKNGRGMGGRGNGWEDGRMEEGMGGRREEGRMDEGMGLKKEAQSNRMCYRYGLGNR